MSPQTGQAQAILAPVLNTAINHQFLGQFSLALAHNVHAALIWDGAGFHRDHDLKVPDNVMLISLPPYSPERNGIENLWHDLRSRCWSNRDYANDDELFAAAPESWCRYCFDTELIKSACAKRLHPSAQLISAIRMRTPFMPIIGRRVPSESHGGRVSACDFVRQMMDKSMSPG